jgi:cyanophycinase
MAEELRIDRASMVLRVALIAALGGGGCNGEDARHFAAATSGDDTTVGQPDPAATTDGSDDTDDTDDTEAETSAETEDSGSDTTGIEEEPKPPLVIVGGSLAESNDVVLDAILARRAEEGPMCVIPIASNSPLDSMVAMVERFDERGGEGTALGVFLSVDNPEDAFEPATVRTLEGCSGFFFTGGLQSRITAVLRPRGVVTPALQAIHARHLEGAIVSGSSAGAAIMSDPMISSGTSAGAMDNGTDADGVRIRDGLGFFEHGIVDQHFLARGRIGRLLVATIEVDAFDVGFGIDEDTALVVDDDVASVIGTSGVVVIDTSDAISDASGSATGLRLHLLGAGDQYDLSTRQPSVAPNKLKIEEDGGAIPVPPNLFASWAFLHLLDDLSRASDDEVVVPVGEHQLTFQKSSDFEAHRHDGEGVQGTPAGLTVGPLLVDVHRA